VLVLKAAIAPRKRPILPGPIGVHKRVSSARGSAVVLDTGRAQDLPDTAQGTLSGATRGLTGCRPSGHPTRYPPGTHRGPTAHPTAAWVTQTARDLPPTVAAEAQAVA